MASSVKCLLLDMSGYETQRGWVVTSPTAAVRLKTQHKLDSWQILFWNTKQRCFRIATKKEHDLLVKLGAFGDHGDDYHRD